MAHADAKRKRTLCQYETILTQQRNNISFRTNKEENFIVKRFLIENYIDDTVMVVISHDIFLSCGSSILLLHSCSSKAVNLQYTYLKVTTGTKRGVVEGETAICLTIAYVFVHPNSLSFPDVKENRIKYFVLYHEPNSY